MKPSVLRTLLYTAKDARRMFEAALTQAQGSFTTFVVLDALAAEEGLTQRALAELLSIEGPTLTRLLDGLEAQKLVERRPSPADRRAYRIYSTAEGRALYEQLVPAACRAEETLLHELPPDEVAAFTRLLEQVRHGLARPAVDARTEHQRAGP
jgi:MarR family transcriptional regulator for hemolysin